MKPIKARFAVPLADVIHGRKYTFLYHRRVRCFCSPPEKYFMCLKCHGRTTILETTNFTIELGKGAEDPRRFVIENITDSSEFFDAGNLEITLESQFNPFYTRLNNDITGNIKLTNQDLQSGYRDIVLPDGADFRIRLENGRAPVRLEGKGIPFENSDRVGDLIIHFFDG
jgi:DnaJ-class molecular chaperone